jgi:hypothetical protein
VAKKTAKVLKGLKKDVAKLQELRDLLEERLEETLTLSSRGTTRATTRDPRSRKRRRGGPRNWA